MTVDELIKKLSTFKRHLAVGIYDHKLKNYNFEIRAVETVERYQKCEYCGQNLVLKDREMFLGVDI